MTKIICDADDCIHRSKRPLRTWKKSNGDKCYACTLEAIYIKRIFDPDGDLFNLLCEEIAVCKDYEPIEN